MAPNQISRRRFHLRDANAGSRRLRTVLPPVTVNVKRVGRMTTKAVSSSRDILESTCKVGREKNMYELDRRRRRRRRRRRSYRN